MRGKIQYEIEDFINNPKPMPIYKMKLEENITSGMQALGTMVVGYPYFKKHQLYMFDMSGKKIDEIAELPKSSIPYSDIEKTDAFYMGFTSNTIDKIAICYYMTDLIEIYSSTGVIQKRIHGPEYFFAYFKEMQDGDGVTSRQVRGKNRDAYFSPKNAGDCFFVLYNGGYVDEKDHTSSCKKMFSFSWNAIPECVYILDEAIFTFCVDKENKKIYGVSNKPDCHIVEYSYE